MHEVLNQLGIAKDSLKNQVVVVTGAARGIGKAIAEVLAFTGARVVIADISPSGADIAEQLNAAGGRAFFIPTDVTREQDVSALVVRTQQVFGPVDIFINNAVRLEVAPVLVMPVEQWDMEYRTNFRAAVLAAKAVLPGMLERGRGVLVHMVSAEGMPLMASYSATKAALKSLVVSLSKELPPQCDLSVFAFHPGMINTPLTGEVIPKLAHWSGMPETEVLEKLAKNPGYDGFMPAEHCAGALAKLLCNAREYHGQAVDAFYPLVRAGVIDIREDMAVEAKLPSREEDAFVPDVKTEMTQLIQQNQNLEIRIQERTRALQEKTEELSHALEELKSAELKLIESEKMALLGHLAAGMAHELNTPTAILRANTDLQEMLFSSSNPSDWEETQWKDKFLTLLSDNRAAIERITEVLRSLKNFARLDEAQFKEADLHEGLNSTLDLLEHQFHGRILREYGNIPRILCRPAQLNQVFMNILLYRETALKDQDKTLSIRTESRDGKVVIRFEDQGEPISQEALQRIFDPGLSVQENRVGMDLSMSISYRIIERHRGSLHVESTPDGTRFVIELPEKGKLS